ncbi:MAG TPA: phosphoribosylaminoimidazolecarboxamide formyltransferase [Candidatus Butyricicoccus stercorigallinarum]|nr:phosphoribosylaminoimidazolecarboxamide formyltransferase [Candidatus Butyricicoccus stercorigallinarum]
MTELELKYGCNPNQKPSRIYSKQGELPITVLNGKPGYINFMDAFNSWQLVRELKEATGMPSAASFKHVSPAGAAIGTPLSDVERQIYFVDTDEALSPIACAYIRARGADRLCSYGDWVALSDECDAQTAAYLKGEVSDGIIAPSYSAEALEILKSKRGGRYTVIQIDPAYEPDAIERREIFGITFEQGHNNLKIDADMLSNIVTENKELTEQAKLDMIVSLITLKYTQSNSVCYVKNGQTIGVGAGQQSRIHCTRLAGNKADNWCLRHHPKVLGLQFVDGIRRPDRDNAIDVYISDEYEDVLADGVWETKFKVKPEPLTVEEKKAWIATQSGVTVGSDAFFPFGDNVERAKKSGVAYIVQPGGSIRDDHVIETCNKYGIVMSFTGIRLFHH